MQMTMEVSRRAFPCEIWNSRHSSSTSHSLAARNLTGLPDTSPAISSRFLRGALLSCWTVFLPASEFHPSSKRLIKAEAAKGKRGDCYPRFDRSIPFKEHKEGDQGACRQKETIIPERPQLNS